MRAVVQRCDGARVIASGEQVGGFTGPGLMALVGVTEGDTPEKARKLAAKVWFLRVFEADRYSQRGCAPLGGKAELSAADLDLPILVISQFTLYGRTDRGRRPTWEAAAPGSVAEPLVDAVAAELRALGCVTSTGRFGADMRVELTNDGPITLILDV